MAKAAAIILLVAITNMLKAVFSVLLRQIVRWMPGFILSRLFSKTKVGDQIKLELRGDTPIGAWLREENPSPGSHQCEGFG